jgi:RHS repeat-associated protein
MFRFFSPILWFAALWVLTGCRESLSVSPQNASVALGQSISFSALAYDRHGQPREAPTVKWEAYSLSEEHRSRISPDGEFTARFPGIYVITAKSGGLFGHAFLRVPDGPVWNPALVPASTTNVSSRYPGATSPPRLPDPPLEGPGWQEATWREAFLADNRIGPPVRIAAQLPRAYLRAIPYHSQLSMPSFVIGTDNYFNAIHLLSLPGRGSNLDLTLFYNSKVWTKLHDFSGTAWMCFDHDHSFPAPGWSLGFGKVIQMGSSGVALEDPDGTLHTFDGTVKTYDPHTLSQFVGHTTDGTFIDSAFTVGWGYILYGQVKYPNGTIVDYGAASNLSNSGALYPRKITDANGNYILIYYRNGTGPAIDHIVDTLARVISFSYDGNGNLVSITAPDYRSGTRVLVKIEYQPIPWDFKDFNFNRYMIPTAKWQIRSLYFPASSTGYWFGDSDSYSGFGMIAKFSQHRGMLANDAGVYSPGQVTHETKYDYPMNPTSLGDVPRYTTKTDTWAGMPAGQGPAVTSYDAHMDDNPRRLRIQYPDGSSVVDKEYNAFQQYNDGLLYEKTTYDANGNLMRTESTSWEQGDVIKDYGSPRIKSVTVTDPLTASSGLAKTIAYGYGPMHNQIADVYEYDFNSSNALRDTHADYNKEQKYLDRHIFNLPQHVSVINKYGLIESQTYYAYDDPRQFYDAPGVSNHDDASNPYAPVTHYPAVRERVCEKTYDTGPLTCSTINDPAMDISAYDPTTDSRGNVTQQTEYTDASIPRGPIVDGYAYDITGNKVVFRPACCEMTVYQYGADTHFGYLKATIRGGVIATPPPTPAPAPTGSSSGPVTSVPPAPSLPSPVSPLLESLTWFDPNTGVLNQVQSPDGRSTIFDYYPGTVRRYRVYLPSNTQANAEITYRYDDIAMTTNADMVDSNGISVSSNTTAVNGLGLVTEIDSSAPAGKQNVTLTQYDQMGRIASVSQPFSVGPGPSPSPTPLWNVTSYDALGRVVAQTAADGSQTVMHYNETTARPSSACSSDVCPGQTVRTVDPAGRERWSRIDALGNTVEVVEPPATPRPPTNGTVQGLVSDPGNVETSYTYNAHGLVTKVLQGPDRQQRLFKYDSLGRLLSARLPEKNATLDDYGNYVGTSNGSWTDVFTYDDRSNYTSHTDARGARTHFGFNDDPLNRLQTITYDYIGPTTPISPIAPSFPVACTYMTTGDVRRLYQVTAQQSNDNTDAIVTEYGYDDQGRLASKTVSSKNYPTLSVGFQYDSLDRMRWETYPREVGTQAMESKRIDYTYDVGNVLSALRVDGVDGATYLKYNASQQLVSATIGPAGETQTTETYDYDPTTGLPSDQKIVSGGTTFDLVYQYTPARQLRELTDSGSVTNYEYDAVDRLKHAFGTTKDGSSWSESYSFDEYGNRTTVDASGAPSEGLPTLFYDTSSNHVTGNAGFAYDDAGNQILTKRADGSSLMLQYDESGRLANIIDPASKATIETYAYDADGHRFMTHSAAGTTYYFWDISKMIAQYSQSGNGAWSWSKGLVYLGNRLLETFLPISSGQRTYFYHPYSLGTRVVTNDTDVTNIQQPTLPFGTLFTGATQDQINPVFTSYDRSSLTNLDYAINRHYDHEQRFTQPDPLGMAGSIPTTPQRLNLYAYASNDPINLVDPVGLQENVTDLATVFVGVAALALNALGLTDAAASLGGAALALNGAEALAGPGAVGVIITTGSTVATGAAVVAVGAAEVAAADLATDSVAQDVEAVLSNSDPGSYASTMVGTTDAGTVTAPSQDSTVDPTTAAPSGPTDAGGGDQGACHTGTGSGATPCLN